MKIIITVCLVLIGIVAYPQKKIGSKTSATQATMYTNKDYKPRTYKKIVVFSAMTDPDQDLRVLKEFSGIGLTVVSSLELFPPPKTFTQEEQKKVLDDNGVDGIIRIEATSTAKMASANLKLGLYDRTATMDAVSFEGKTAVSLYSAAWDPDKTTIKFIRKIIDELKPLVGK